MSEPLFRGGQVEPQRSVHPPVRPSTGLMIHGVDLARLGDIEVSAADEHTRTYRIRGNNVQFPERCPHCFAGPDEMCKTLKGERANRIHNGRAVKVIWHDSEEHTSAVETVPEVQCDHCGKWHEAVYSHEGQYGEGPIYAVVCPEDDLTDYYTGERVEQRPAPKRIDFSTRTSAARRCESCGSSIPGRMARQRDEAGRLVCGSCKNNGFARWNVTYAQQVLGPEAAAEFERREAEALASLTRVTGAERRTAKVPDKFWEKTNSERSQRRLDASRTNPDQPVCSACGSSLNPATAKQVAITGGGETALHPDDATDADHNDPGWMGGWSLGPECARMFSAKVLRPYRETKTSASTGNLVSQLLAMDQPSSKKSFDVGDLHYVVYLDTDVATGDNGRPVHGDMSGAYEVWHTDPQESDSSFKIVLRQTISPGKSGGMQQAYAARMCAQAMVNRSMSMAPRRSMHVEAHDSGDGATIFHCPFCGSGAVTGGFDGTVTCAFCKQHFTVQVQPEFHAMPQTVNGQPFNVPGMPGGGPDAGAAPEEERAQQEDAQDDQPGQPKAPVAEGGQDQPPPDDPSVIQPIGMMLVDGIALPVDKALQHFALAHATDRETVLAQVREENGAT